MKKYLKVFLISVVIAIYVSGSAFAAWDKTKPADDEYKYLVPAAIRANWDAIELGTDAALLITNDKVSPTAAIVDTKLAQITTANKVSGTALTGLGSIPAGAGQVPIANGGTGGSTAALARANLGAATSGANSDITSLSGLTTPLSKAQGGTGTTSGVVLPSGAVFFMITGSCPSGTTDVTATYADKFLRVNATQGTTGGSDTVSIAEANLPAHTHGGGTLSAASGGAHIHSMQGVDKPFAGQTSGFDYGIGTDLGMITIPSAGAHTHTISGSTDSSGSGTATTVTNPYVTCKLCQVN